MKVLLIGSGGREHALAWKIRASPLVSQLFVVPGNPGIRSLGTCPQVSHDPASIVSFAKAEGIDIAVVGPDAYLEQGIVDSFRASGISVVGPTKEAARLETSKDFAKQIMVASGVPTARSVSVHSVEEGQAEVARRAVPIVLKADGLAAGKGVCVCSSMGEVEAGLKYLFHELHSPVVLVEDFLEGVEVSLIVATNGEEIVPLASAHDYKRLLDGNRGPNTGGMGTVSPSPRLSAESYDRALSLVIEPVLRQMKSRGVPFTGFLYAGLMIGPSGSVHVLEYNARLGDPETQVLLRRLSSDIVPLLMWMAAPPGTVARPSLEWREDHAVCVVLAAEGYPFAPRAGDEIEGISFARALPDIEVFHAGTKEGEGGSVRVSGGRVLNVTALGVSVEEARRRAYRAVDMIQFPGRICRRDIGL